MSSTLLAGDLQFIPLPDIMLLLTNNRKNGSLFCQNAGISKVLEFEKGNIVFARSTMAEDRLGEYLVSHRIVTESQLRRAEPSTGNQERLGKSLVRVGLLTPDTLWEHVRGQVTEIIYSLFMWKRGSFEFREGTPQPEKISLDVSVMTLIIEGTRRLDEWSRVREKIQSDGVVLAPVKSPGQVDPSVSLSEVEQTVLTLVDGRRTVRMIVKRSCQGRFQTWQALHSLLSAGLIRIQLLALDPPSPHSIEPVIAPADEALEQALDRYGEAVALILDRAGQQHGSDEVARLRRKLRNAAFERAELLRDVAIEPDGRIDRRVLLANVAEDPPLQRERNLQTALDSLVHFLACELKGKVEVDDVLEILKSGSNNPA
jgi:hypothetical protein